MSAIAEAAPTKPSGKKKQIVIASVVAIAVSGGAGAYFALKPKPAEAGKEGAKGEPTAEHKRDPKTKPTFVSFESFTVNLNDKENERYAQIVFAVETIDAATGEMVKTQMPALRGRVLMTLSSKTASDLSGREGKEKLAKDILEDVRKTLGLPEGDKSLIEVHFSQFVMQ